MSELALYRKYRSTAFTEVAGQQHVVDTLSSALKHGRISHAYLFTGPRGVGKTSVARLLAKAVNCTDEKVRPCNACDICAIDLSGNLDIIEIDAASNRRIDEIRDLRDKIHLAPARSKYRVYIIDEVHMLTNEAFNALLKTLEEPPSHVIFILATTEIHKLPETIVSRTQRYAFKSITQADLARHLQKIASSENISLTPEALDILAAASRGSFRDGISLLDQVANMQGETVDATQVRRILGLGSNEGILQICRAIARNQPKDALSTLDTLTGQGIDPAQILSQLILAWRTIMLTAVGAGKQPAEMTELAKEIPLNKIIRSIDILTVAAASSWPAIALEAALVRLSADIEPDVPAVKPVQAPAQTSKPAPTPPAAIPTKPKTAHELKPQPTAKKPAAPEAPAVVPKSGEVPDAGLWPKALAEIKSRNNSLYALLCSCQVEMSEGQVTINCRFKWFKDRLDESKNRQIVEQALDATFGQKLRIMTVVASGAKPAQPEKELVSTALEILGGEIVHG